ncbi:MAG: hypothetical protein KDJ52_20120 [Anaerolineae bacterium]|nr:hypothetical protein [Anaerolineae bacterium]
MFLLITLSTVFLIGCALIWGIFRLFVQGLNLYVSSHFSTPFWLAVGIVGANITSLGYGTWHPATSGGLFFSSVPETIHRGWPLPWYGLPNNAFGILIMPFTLLVDVIVWSFIIGYLIYLVVALVHYRQRSPVHPWVVRGAVVGGMVFAYVIPFLISPVVFS